MTEEQTMKRLALMATFSAMVLLAACTAPETYPVSGEACGPDDAVKQVDALDCLPA